MRATMGVKIEKLMLWRVSQKETAENLKFIFSEVAKFYKKPDSTKELLKETFKEGSFILARDLDLRPLALKNGVFNVPIIARDKKLDAPVLLVPSATDFTVKSRLKKSYPVNAHQVRSLFDEHIFLFPMHMAVPGFFAPPFLWLLLFIGLSILFFLASLASALAMITSAKDIYLAAASLLFFSIGMILSFLALKIATKDYDSSLFAHLFSFYQRLFVAENLFKDGPDHKAMAQEIKDSSYDYFFNRVPAIFSGLTFLASFFLLFWLKTLWPFLTCGVLVIFLLALWLKHQNEAQEQAFKEQQELSLTLEQYRLSFQAIHGLKAFKGFDQKLQKDGLKREKLLAIEYQKKTLPLLSALILAFCFALWLSHFSQDLSLWQVVWLFTAALLLGVVFSAGIFGFKTKIPNIESLILSTHVEPAHILGSFEVIAMSFAYQDASNLIFKNFSLSLKPLEFYVISGTSGVGKTTLLKLLMGELRPTNGQIVIDGQDLRSLNPSSLKKHFGVIFDDSQLFMGSIYDNIMCGRDLPKNLEKLLLSHEIFDTLIDMPMGLHSFVFWHQKNISHYEKALILLARALVHNPQVLFMDEFISSLNFEDQARIFSFLQSLSKTRILVSNNPNFVTAQIIRL